jgi:DNA-binding MarR family transcriptional regulator
MVVDDELRSPQTDLGLALRIAWWSYANRVDGEMRTAGFADWRFPMIYMLALYALPSQITISQMGRQFAISRQAASKIVGQLRDLGYVDVRQSRTDQREKVIELTDSAIEYVTARRQAASRLDDQIASRLTDGAVQQLHRLLDEIAQIANGDAGFSPANLYRPPKAW